MDFSLHDIALLYGEEIYVLPDYAGLPPQSADLMVAEAVAPVSVPVAAPVRPVEAPVVPQTPVETPVAAPVKPVATPVTPVAPPPVAQPVAPPPVAPVAVSWKLRPTSRFAMVMTEAEFARKLLTGALRNFVESAKIPLEYAGFGVIPDASTAWLLADAPVPVVVMLVPRPPGWVSPAGKTVYFADQLTAVVMDPAKEQLLAGMMQEVMRAVTY